MKGSKRTASKDKTHPLQAIHFLPKNELLAQAEKDGHDWCVLDPDPRYPMQLLGFRLMQYRPDFPPDEYGERWCCVQMGAGDVLKRLEKQLNDQKKEFPDLYQPKAIDTPTPPDAALKRLENLPRMEP